MKTNLLFLFCFCLSSLATGQEVSVGSYFHLGENVLPFGEIDSDPYPTFYDISYDHSIGKRYFIRAGLAAWAFDKYDYQNYKNSEESYGLRLGFGATVYKFWNNKIHLKGMFLGRNYEAKNVRTSLFFNDVFTEKKYIGFTMQLSSIVRWQITSRWHLSLQSHFSILDINQIKSHSFVKEELIMESKKKSRVLAFPSDFLVGISVGYSFKKIEIPIDSNSSL